jgi:hypothetical protein
VRNLFRITPVQLSSDAPSAIPTDALILTIGPQNVPSGLGGGFILYNTHSLPVRLEDSWITQVEPGKGTFSLPLTAYLASPSCGRTLAPVQPYTGAALAATFHASYSLPPDGGENPSYRNRLISFNWGPRYVEPQIALADAWDAPFFYEDRQHVFYVTTTDHYRTVVSFDGFGVLSATSSHFDPVLDLPPLVFKTPPQLRDVPDTIVAGNMIFQGYSTGMQGYLSRSQTIRTAVGATDPISYQGRQIYPGGSIGDVARPAGKV